jgi:hypothetical protein
MFMPSQFDNLRASFDTMSPAKKKEFIAKLKAMANNSPAHMAFITECTQKYYAELGIVPTAGVGTYGHAPKGKAIASMVLGITSIASFCFFFVSIPCAIIGLVLGITSKKKREGGSGMATAGVATSVVGLAVTVGLIIMSVFLSSIFSNPFSSYSRYF